MCACLKKPLAEGAFTIHRNENLFWSGTLTDMTIEQSLMRSGKTHGGLVNITHKESARTQWLLTAHIVAQYSEAFRKLTENAGGTWSKQHQELYQGSRIRDHDDLQKFLVFLRSHNPFTSADPTQLRNIYTGLVADHRVNVDDALTIGAKIQEILTGKRFIDVTMKKKDQAQTFSIMRKPIKVDGEDVRTSPAQLYRRLLCIARTNGPPDPCIFSSEMTAVAPALFKEDGSMRTSQKSQLAKHVVGKDPNSTRKQYDNSAGRVYDGCALIHRLAWPKVGTMGSVWETFVGYVLASAAPDVQVCVVFDCYDQQTTKGPEQNRRRLKTGSYPDVVLEYNTPVPGKKDAFLGNMANKQLLSCQLI